MEHHTEHLARSPTTDFKYLLDTIPKKYFKEIVNRVNIKTEQPDETSGKITREVRRKQKQQRKRQFRNICSAALSYMKSLESLLLYVMERKGGSCSLNSTICYYPSQTQMSLDEGGGLSSELQYIYSRFRPGNMTDEDKYVMQYIIHEQIEAVDPHFCASLQMFQDQALAAWPCQQRSLSPACLGVPPALYPPPPVGTSLKMSGGGIVQQQRLSSSPPPPPPPVDLFPCCTNASTCPLLPHSPLAIDCPQCTACGDVGLSDDSVAASLCCQPPELPQVPSTAMDREVLSACSRLCDSSLDFCCESSSPCHLQNPGSSSAVSSPIRNSSLRNSPMLHNSPSRKSPMLNSQSIRNSPMLSAGPMRNSPMPHSSLVKHSPPQPSSSASSRRQQDDGNSSPSQRRVAHFLLPASADTTGEVANLCFSQEAADSSYNVLPTALIYPSSSSSSTIQHLSSTSFINESSAMVVVKQEIKQEKEEEDTAPATEPPPTYQSVMEDLLLDGCDSPTESFGDFDSNLWSGKVPMDIDDIDVAQLAF